MPDPKRILLVQSRTEFQTEYTHRPHLPLSLLSAARLLWRDHPVRILDQRTVAAGDWWNRLAGALEEEPICVGLTCLTGKQIRHALAISRFVKDRSRAPVVWGGPHATLLPEQTLESGAVDFVVEGEGEHAFSGLVRALEEGRDPLSVAGVWGREDGRIRSGPPAAAVDLEALPPFPYPLVDLETYKMYRETGPTLSIETSRGCPFGCRFCYSSRSRAWRALGPEKVIAAIEELAIGHGVRSLILIDENFFVDLGRAREIFERLVARGLGVKMETQGLRVSDIVHRMDGAFLDLMAGAGMVKLDIGAESGSGRVLDFIQKGIGPSEILEANRKLARHGFLAKYNFIAGFPTETRGEMRETVGLAFRLLEENPKAEVGWINLYASHPGTPLYAWEVEHGLEPPANLGEWARVDRQNGTGRDAKLLEAIYFTSHFMKLDSGYRFFFHSRILFVLLSIYRPLAIFRLRHFFFPLMIESAIARALAALVSRRALWAVEIGGRLGARPRRGPAGGARAGRGKKPS